MAKCVSLKRRLYDRIPDWIWPHLKGDAEPGPRDQDHFGAKHAELLDEISRFFPSRLAQVEERVRSVESKLMAQLTLTSVLSAAVTASLAAAAMLGTVEEDARIFAWVAVLLVLYVALQLLCSLRATVAGLKRRSYRQLSPADIVPQDDETSKAYRVRLLNLQVNCVRLNEWVTDQKVSEMAVAHAALRNVLTATFVLIVLTLVVASVHLARGSDVPDPPEDTRIRNLEQPLGHRKSPTFARDFWDTFV